MNRMKLGRALLTGVLTAALLAAPVHAQNGDASEAAIRIGSYKGDTLAVGERSGLIIGPGKEMAQTVTSSAPAVVSIENVQGLWVAVTHAEGTATVTATSRSGETASVTLTVGNPAKDYPTLAESAAQALEAEATEPSLDSLENAEPRLELVRLINEVRRENGVPELTINMALMDAAQEHAARQYTTHHRKEECETVASHGYPYGFACNLTAFTIVDPDEIPQRAVRNWRNSPGHFQTMIGTRYDAIGVGIVTTDGWTYCYLFVGNPNSCNPYT